MTRGRLWTSFVAVVLLGAATVIIVGGWPPKAPWFGDSCGIPQSIAPDAPVAVSDRDSLRVVEQGLTQPVDEFNSVSLGAVLENTSDRIAYRTRVTFRLADAENRGIAGFEATEDEIPIIMPGQRVGAGMTVSPAITDAASRRIATFQVDTETSRWLPSDALGDDFTPVTAEYRYLLRRDPQVPLSTEIHFVPTSTACRPLVGWNPAALFRNGNGAIVGGTRQYSLVTDSCSRIGEETWVIPRKAIPPTADDARTELYPYCDIQ